MNPSNFEKNLKSIVLLLVMVLPFVAIELNRIVDPPAWMSIVLAVITGLTMGGGIYLREAKIKGSSVDADDVVEDVVPPPPETKV